MPLDASTRFRNWPLNPDGPLPKLLYSSDFLFRAFTCVANANAGFKWRYARKGLEEIAVKLFGCVPDEVNGLQSPDEKVRYLLPLVLDTRRGRDLFQKINLHWESSKFKTGPILRKNEKLDKYCGNFSTFIWGPFRFESELFYFRDWFRENCYNKEGSTYLSMDKFSLSLSEGVPVGDLDFYRALVAYCGLEAPSAAIQFLNLVEGAGGVLPPEIIEIESVNVVAAAPEDKRLDEVPVVKIENWPRIQANSLQNWMIEESVNVRHLEDDEKKIDEIRDGINSEYAKLSAHTQIIFANLIGYLETANLQKLIDIATSLQHSLSAMDEARRHSSQQKIDFIIGAVEHLALSETEKDAIADQAQSAPIDELADFALVARLCGGLGRASRDLLQSLKSKLRIGGSISEYTAALAPSRERHSIKIFQQQFESQLQNRLRQPVTLDEWQNWLNELTPNEIGTLLDSISEPKHSFLRAFFARLLGERSWQQCANWFEISVLSEERHENLQAALRWIDALQIDQLNNVYPNFARLTVCELYRDGITSQTSAPLWVIQRLADSDTLGQPLSEFFQAFPPILSQRDSVLDLIQALRFDEEKIVNPEKAAKELEEFIKTPCGMGGNFYRLREAARYEIFSPLLNGKRFEDAKIESLLAEWDADAIADSVEEVAEDRYPSLYIDSRHRLQLTRYLQEGKALLSNYISIRPAQSAADHSFASSLRRAFKQLVEVVASGDAPIGTVNWLQQEIVKLTHGGGVTEGQVFSTLGDERVLSASLGANDVRWAEEKLPVPAFYSGSGRPTALQVSLEVASNWANSERYGAPDILNALLSQGRYSQARHYLTRSDLDEDIRSKGADLIEKEVFLAKSTIQQQLLVLCEQFGDLVNHSESYGLAQSALNESEIADARLYVGMVEEELKQAQRRHHIMEESRDPKLQKEKVRFKELIRVAGGSADIGDTSIDELRAILQGLLDVNAARRSHLRPVEEFLASRRSKLIELGFDADALEALMADQKVWLTEELVGRFTELINLNVVVEYFKEWLDSNKDSENRRIKFIIEWFFLQLRRSITSVKETDDLSEVDDELERLLGYCFAVSKSADDTLAKLKGLDETLGLFADTSTHSVDDLSEASTKLIGALEKANWPNVLHWSAFLVGRSEADGEDRHERRLAQDARRLALCITQSDLTSAGDEELLVAADALTTRRLLDLLPVAIVLDIARTITIRLSREDKSESEDFSERHLLARLENLRNGPLFDALHKFISAPFGERFITYLWQTVTGRSSKPGVDRGSLLHFLYRNGLSEAISQLAERYDSNMQLSIERMVELRQIAESRPELLGTAQMFGETVMTQASEPFRQLADRLIKAPVKSEPKLEVEIEGSPQASEDDNGQLLIEIPLIIRPISTVIAGALVRIGPGADVSFEKGQQLMRLTDQPVYEQIVYPIKIVLGSTWRGKSPSSFPLTIEASTIVDQKISASIDVTVKSSEGSQKPLFSVTADDLDDLFPGNHLSVRVGPMLIGRRQEMGDLERLLVKTPHPSPVLVTGLRRIGKTSLVRTLHENLRTPGASEALSVYAVIGSKGDRFAWSGQSVAREFFDCLKGSIDKPQLTNDSNGPLKKRLRQDLTAVEIGQQLEACWVSDSLADSIAQLADWISIHAGMSGRRVVFIVDEAEALMHAMLASNEKLLQLSSVMHGLRELSQNHSNVGILLCSSNNIDRLVDSYTDAFFGSCHHLKLTGIFDFEDARQIIAPTRIGNFLTYSEDVVRYIIDICQGMPLAMSLVSAAAAWIVRTGRVERHQVRRALSALLDDACADMPATLRRWRVLESINQLLDLEGGVEKSRLFVLLYRIAAQSSLINPEARSIMVINEELRAVLTPDEWRTRIARLRSLDLISAVGGGIYRFKVPIFAEAMRINQLQRYYAELESCQ